MSLQTTLNGVATTEVRARHLEPGDFDWIVRQHQKQIYRLLLLLVRDPDAADTLTQECFLRALRKHEGFRGESGLATWLVRIAINLAHDHNRNRRLAFWRRLIHAESTTFTEVPDSRCSPEQILMAREKLAIVWSAVQRLPERQRIAFLLRFAEEMPLEAIAEAMGLEVGTVKAHLYRAVETVRSACNHRGSRACGTEAQE